MQGVILVGGLGTRLKEIREKLCNGCPKPMVPVKAHDGKYYPLVEYAMSNLYTQGVREFVFIDGFKGDEIRNHFENGRNFGIDVAYSSAGKNAELNTGAALKMASSYITDNFFLSCGDVYVEHSIENLVNGFTDSKNVVRMSVYSNMATLSDTNTNVGLDKNGNVTEYSREGVNQNEVYISGVDTGLLLMTEDVFDYIMNDNKERIAEDLYPRLIGFKNIDGNVTEGPFYDVGTPARYNVFSELAISGIVKPISLLK